MAEAASTSGPLAVLMTGGPLKDKPTQLKAAFDSWVTAQPPWVDALSAGLFGSLQGAFLGSLMGSMAQMNPEQGAAAVGPGAQMMKMGGPFQQARNFAVMTGVNSGMHTLMRRVRKVDDVQNTLVAGFTSGAAFSLVSGMGNATPAVAGGSPNPLMGAISAGVVFALFQGGFYKMGEAFSGPKVADTEYARVKAMLSSLGLTQYERNLKKAQLDDRTIMLWDTPALQEAKVPAGPRLLILHHINQFRGNADLVRDILRPALPVPSGPRP